MSPIRASSALLPLVAACLLGLVSCPAPTPGPQNTDPSWTFDTDMDGWETVLYDGASKNTDATLSWSASEGSPGVGALRIDVPFAGMFEYVSVIAPIVADPLNSGTDLTGKKFSVRVKSAVSFTGGALIFSNSGPNPQFPPGDSAMAALNTTEWVLLELDLTQVSNPDYDPADMRFLGVIFATGTYTDPPDGTYTFYVDTAVIEDAP